MKKPNVEFIVGLDGSLTACVNDRYWIYLDDGVVYDTVAAKDIPQYVFGIRDTLMTAIDELRKTCLVNTKIDNLAGQNKREMLINSFAEGQTFYEVDTKKHCVLLPQNEELAKSGVWEFKVYDENLKELYITSATKERLAEDILNGYMQTVAELPSKNDKQHEIIVPSYEQIKRDYDMLMAAVGEVQTIDELREVCKKYSLTAEINDMTIDEFVAADGRDEDIDCIWYNTFGCLNYIYFNKGFSEPSFDVTAPNFPSTRLEGVTMSELTEEYYNNAIAEVTQHGDVGKLIEGASDKSVRAVQQWMKEVENEFSK